jgi:uncharacterized Zn finger protein
MTIVLERRNGSWVTVEPCKQCGNDQDFTHTVVNYTAAVMCNRCGTIQTATEMKEYKA